MFKRLMGILAVIVLMAAMVPVSQAQGYCYGALPTRLQVGGQGRVTPGLPNSLRTQPYRGYDSIVLGEIPAGGVFTVIGGPSCFDGMYWWQVNYNGTMGWTPEGSNTGVYWTEPVTNNTGCMSVVSRLSVGATGRVTPGLPNTLRTQPIQGAGSGFITNIYAGSQFYIIGGPVCNNGITWWQINYNGLTGWTGEGQGYQYWAEPVGPVSTPIPVCNDSFMILNSTGRVRPGLPNRLRAQPTVNSATLASMPAGDTFIVLSGPNCVDGLSWWQVSYRGTIGWTAQSQTNGQNWIEPVICTGFQPSRISAGRSTRVTPGLPNRLRAAASTASAVLTFIPAGGTATVLSGPICSENAAWWRVSYGGIVGWTMEGQGNQYWLERVN
ncbi:MAG: SH3 domain-containing protein [Anaerolineae bacterium]|nr:SH3 domain-containing protein [Anaerolineae bacterium]